jgi:hypothetical protein
MDSHGAEVMDRAPRRQTLSTLRALRVLRARPLPRTGLKKSLAFVYWVSSVNDIVMQILTEDRPTADMHRTVGVTRMIRAWLGAGCCRRDN